MPDPLDIFGSVAAPDPLDIFGASLVEDEEELRRRKRRQLEEAQRIGGEQAARLDLPEGEAPDYLPAWLAKAGRGAAAGATGVASLATRFLDPRAGGAQGMVHRSPVVPGVPVEDLGIAALNRADERAQAADQAARERLAAASVDLPTPVAAAGAWTAEGAGMALDPLELLPGGMAARGATAAARGLRRAPKAVPVADDLLELARVSQVNGASHPAVRRAASVDPLPGNPEDPVRRLAARDEAGEPIGSMTYSVEPDGGFRVMDVETGVRGSGGMRAMMRRASEESGGPYLGSMAETDEGAAALARLRETDPEIFESVGTAKVAPLATWRVRSLVEGGDNFLGPLASFTPRIFRETSPNEARFLVPGGGSSDTTGELFFSNDPHLALGQGANKGVLLEFDSADLQGVANTSKPGWRLAMEEGSAEFVARLNHDTAYKRSLRSITVQPGTKLGGFRYNIQNLERNGWRRVGLEDGGYRLSRPVATKETLVPQSPGQPLNMAAARVQGERLGAVAADIPPGGSLPPLPELADAPKGLHRLVDWGRSRLESFGQFGPASRRFVDPEIRQYVRHKLPREVEMAAAEAETLERQAQRLRHGFEDAVRQVAKETGENPAVLRRQANAARIAGDTSQLPETIRAAVDSAGEWVDNMSRRMVDEGMAGSKVETFQANMGSYLHRSYGARDTADFVDLMRGRPEFDEAQRFLVDLYPDKSPDEIIGIVNQLMDPNDGRFALTFGRKGGVLPKQDLRELRRRKEIAEPLRRLMGEREDFGVNLQRTAALQAHDLAFHKLSQRVAEEGKRLGIFQETPRGDFYRALPESQQWGELEGLNTLPEVEQLLGGFEQHSRSAISAYVNGLAKFGKVAISPVTQLRNWTSGFGLSLANGRFLPSPAWRNQLRHFVEADRVATSTVFGHSDTALSRFKVSDLDELAATIEEATQYRVLSPGARAGEVLDYATEVAHHLEAPGRAGAPRGRVRRGAAQAARKTGEVFSRTYRSGDDFWKVFNWKAEVDELAWANEAYPVGHPRRRTAEAIKAEAAELVNEQLQTYSRAAPVGRSLARNPLFGAFATFQLEAPRNLKNIFKRGLAEIVEAKETGNVRMAALGAKRLTGASATLALPPAVATWALAEHGFDAEKEEAFRSFIPPYLENSRIVPMARDGSKVIFVATQDQDYFNGPQRLYLAFARPGSPLERFERLAMEGVNLYLGEQPGVVPAVEALMNRRMGGALDIVEPGVGARSEVYRDTATLPAKVGAAAAHVGRGLAPGAVTTGERVLRATGVMENPRALDPQAEVVTAITGVRHQTVDIADSFGFKARDWARERSEISAAFNKAVREQGAARNPKLMLQFQREREAEWRPRYQAIQQYVEDARTLGLSRRQIDGLLEDAEIGEDMREALIRGRYISFLQYKRRQRAGR